MKFLISCLGLMLFVFFLYSSAIAQNPVITQPYSVNTQVNASSTIAVTNTFQSVFAASTQEIGRVGCTIQNTGTNSMYVFFGAIASATIATSIKLTAGQSTTCASGNIILKMQVSITGTATETFYAASQ